MSIGACADGRKDSVYDKQPVAARSCLRDLKPHTIRLPWVNNQTTHDLIGWCNQQGIDVLVHDLATFGQADPYGPEQMIDQIVGSGLTVAAVEGTNEVDLKAPLVAGHRQITADQLAYATDRQTRLYQAVAGWWPVLSPSAAWWRDNEAALTSLPHDIVSCHRYAARAPAATDAELPVGRVWVTETGWSTYKKSWPSNQWVISEENQRDWLVSMRSMLLANGAERVLVYQLMDSVDRSIFNQSNSGPATKGLYRYEGNPKLAANALNGSTS